jgi:arylsulfatase A-like enzyme
MALDGAGRLLAALALCAVLTAPAQAQTPNPPTRPNIVLIVADDWGFSDVGAFGSEIATPHLDELARRGVRFSNFHVAGSCSPTRAMLLTGVDHHLAGVGNLRETMPGAHLGRPGYTGSLGRNVVSLASLLQDGGYRTYIAGKWNVGSEPHNLPPQRGFQRSIVQGDTGSDNWDPLQRYLPHSARVDWFEDGKPAVMPREFYSSEYFTDRILAYIRDGQAQDQRAGPSGARPFFAYLAFQANHVPLQAPKAFIDKYKGRYDAGWTALRQARRDRAAALGLVPKDTPMVSQASTPDWNSLGSKQKQHAARSMEVYAGMAEALDHHVGRLVAHLKQSGAYDNTVFVFLSDNGAEGSDYQIAQLWLSTQYTQDTEQLGARGAYAIQGPGWASASVAPLSTYKFYAGEGGIRVPLIVSGLAGVKGAGIEHNLVFVNDIAPTLLELAQINHPGKTYKGQAVQAMAGRSLLPLLRGQAQRLYLPEQPIGYELSGNQALFKGDLKLVKNLPPVGDGQWRLFDIRKDPGETVDLRPLLPDVFKTMVADYDAYAKAHGVLPMPEGYDPIHQVLINSFVNYWWPAYRMPALVVLLGLMLLTAALLRRRRRRRRA